MDKFSYPQDLAHYDSKILHQTTSTKKGVLENVEGELKQFCSLTSLHGFKYLGEGRPFSEKIFWLAVLVSVFVVCAFQTYSLFEHWQAGHILMTHEAAKFHVWDIPFPAITICFNELDNTRITKVNVSSEYYSDVKDYIIARCWEKYNKKDPETFINNSALQFLYQNVLRNCNDTILFFRWQNEAVEEYPCYYMQPTMSINGLCHTLNMVPHHIVLSPEFTKMLRSYSKIEYAFKNKAPTWDWNPLTGFRTNDPNLLPWRAFGDGFYNSVRLAINVKPSDFEPACAIEDIGATVEIHNTIEYPMDTAPFSLQAGSYLRLILMPHLTSTSDLLQHWDPLTRGCYYMYEKPLRFFQLYTQNNCETECRANRTMERCGCAAYYDPRDVNTPICGKSKRDCVRQSRHNEYTVLGNKSISEFYNIFQITCLCLPKCHTLAFDVEAVELKRNISLLRDSNPSIRPEHKDVAFVEIYFKQRLVESRLRSPVIRFNELLANVGGVISLCIGCSIVSMFEVIYFCTLRQWSRHTDNSKKLAKGKLVFLH